MPDPDAALVDYNNFRKTHPELFVNSPDAGLQLIFDQDVLKETGAGVIYRDAYLVLLRDAVRHTAYGNELVVPYIRLIPADNAQGVAILPLYDDRIMLIHCFRHATRSWHWEIPRGFAKCGELPKDAARHEVHEELGTSVTELTELGCTYPCSAVSNVCLNIFLARLTGPSSIGTNEEIAACRLVTTNEFDDMVLGGEITDSISIVAVLQARLRGLLGDR